MCSTVLLGSLPIRAYYLSLSLPSISTHVPLLFILKNFRFSLFNMVLAPKTLYLAATISPSSLHPRLWCLFLHQAPPSSHTSLHHGYDHAIFSLQPLVHLHCHHNALLHLLALQRHLARTPMMISYAFNLFPPPLPLAPSALLDLTSTTSSLPLSMAIACPSHAPPLSSVISSVVWP